MPPSPNLTKDGGLFEALSGSTFKFLCHPGIGCFNQCCADLNLLLTPYDVLRLKNHLGLRAEDFLERHTDPRPGDSRFPMLQLKMSDQPGRPCPFVTSNGCSVYPDRPSACRTYPLGRGSAAGGREMFLVVKEAHCRGFIEDRTWEVNEWLANQGLEIYNRLNDRWMEIVTAKDSLGAEDRVVSKLQMFVMVSYNLDRFRDFVFGSRFLDRFALGSEQVDRVRSEDESLLDLGFDWLNFALYGRKTLLLKT
ncbi:MAG: YkgJ family cysteine cluster protein [Deltaproteobacteria bacterium]|nr:YkgJ family cysteine cluster protein [Deltaproteobacteria bacterium]